MANTMKKPPEKVLAAAVRMQFHYSGSNAFWYKSDREHAIDTLLVAKYVLSLEHQPVKGKGIGNQVVNRLRKFSSDLERGDLSGYKITTVKRTTRAKGWK